MVTNSSVDGSGEEFDVADMSTWSWQLVIAYWTTVVAGQEVLAFINDAFGRLTDWRIPKSGHSLNTFGWKDWLFVYINRISVPVMTFHVFQYTWNSKKIFWSPKDLSFMSTIGAVVALFLTYDAFYVPFHSLLHVRALYPWIHKHHHRQNVPTRGNLDATNTHPIEFILGEYLHLVSLFVVSTFVMKIHVGTVIFFILFGGLLASLNHTRFDVSIPFFYDVRAHDMHHHMPMSNYGQYTMVWDKVVGTFRPYRKEMIHASASEKKD